MADKITWRSIERHILDGKKLTRSEEEWASKKTQSYWDEHPDVTNRYPRWKKYIAWVAGYQLFDYNKISKKLVEVPLARQRKLIFNKLKPFVRTILAKLSAEPHVPSVAPATDDWEDVEAARAGEHLIDGLQQKIGFSTQLNNVKLWTIICNKAYFRTFWNKDSFGLLGFEDVEEHDEDGLLIGMKENQPSLERGDVDIECVSPFNCRQDPLYTDRDRWRWFIYGEEVDAEELEEEYDLKEGELQEQSNVLDTAYDIELQDEQDIIIGAPDRQEDIKGRTVVYKEFWTPKIFMICAGTKVLDYDVNPYEEIPFYSVEERLVPISSYEPEFSYNESLIKDAIPIQREYNRQVSIMSIALDRASKLKVMAPLGSILNKRQWTNEYGVFIDYNKSMGEPYQMKLDPFPFQMPQYVSQLEGEMQSVMNLHPASFGQLPERASHPSGSLVNLLVEQDDVVLNPLLNSINESMSEAWSLALRIVQENYTVGRLLKFTGEDGFPSVQKFRGADIRGNTDVRFTTTSGLPKSRALRTEYIKQLYEIGLITDPKDVLELLEFGRAHRVFKDQLLHERKADRENMLIDNTPDITPDVLFGNEEQGIPGIVYNGDDDSIHLKKHEQVRLSAKYERWTPAQQNALNQLIGYHQDNLQKAQQAQYEQAIKASIEEEMGKTQAKIALEQARTVGKIDIEKIRTKGDMILEALKQQGAITDELIKNAVGGVRKAYGDGSTKKKSEGTTE